MGTGNIVRKYYNTSSDMQKELEIYEKKLNFIPQLENSGDNWLEFEYKEGANLWEMVRIDFSAVAQLYASLHNVQSRGDFTICQIDTNPKNVLYVCSEDKYYLIDFVDWRWEYPEFDIIHFLMFFTAFYDQKNYIKICEDYISGYRKLRDIDQSKWQNSFKKAESYFDNRRKKFDKREINSSPDVSVNREYLRSLDLKLDK